MLTSLFPSPGPRLYIPDEPVFSDGILSCEQHIAYIDFGINNFLNSDSLTSFPVVAVTIPFLSGHPKEPPKYSLALGELFQRNNSLISSSNFAFPHITIDEVTITSDEVILRNGSDEMRVSYTRYIDPCVPTSSRVRDEFEQFLSEDKEIGAAETNFDICDIEQFQQSEFCKIVDGIRCGISRVGPNFCQSAWNSSDKVVCKTTFEFLNVTSGFRNFMMMKEDPVNILATESLYGNFTIGVDYPCID